MKVVVGYVLSAETLILIRRSKDPYAGYLSLPGGKVEESDDTYEIAMRRELSEETGLEAEGIEKVGVCYETLIESDRRAYFEMHIYAITAAGRLRESSEGTIERIRESDLHHHAHRIIPSDYAIITRILNGERGFAYTCTMRLENGVYALSDELD